MAEKDFIIEEKTTEETKEEVKEETPLEDVVLETEGGTKSLLGATSGTDIAATSLDTKTTPAGTDNLILFNQNTNVGYQIDYDNLADAILNKITSKTFANQVGGSSAATLLAQLSTLNSNKLSKGETVITASRNESIVTGGYAHTVVIGRSAFPVGELVIPNAPSNGDIIISNLPIPKETNTSFFPMLLLVNANGFIRARINTSGQLVVFDSSNTATGTFRIIGAYVVDETLAT